MKYKKQRNSFPVYRDFVGMLSSASYPEEASVGECMSGLACAREICEVKGLEEHPLILPCPMHKQSNKNAIKYGITSPMISNFKLSVQRSRTLIPQPHSTPLKAELAELRRCSEEEACVLGCAKKSSWVWLSHALSALPLP